MGISGLLPLLKSIHKPCSLKKFKGLTIGVDAYGWLHRGTVACAIDLALDKPNTKFVDFAMHRVRMLIHFGITPYIVFDGDYLPSKASTEGARAEKRAESKRVGLELYRMGKPSQAHLELQKAVDVTPEMARLLIEELKRHDVQYVVAPYEADAQLVYLEKKGIIQGIISEDSDMLVFGTKRLLTKLDQYGECVEIHRDDFTACKEISLVGWSDADFRRMAILSGCDYLTNINKMGLKTAYRLVRKYKTIERILQIVQLNGQYRVPPGYLDDFRRAELTFLHQRVFCPLKSMMVMATELGTGPEPEDLAFIGKYVEPNIALGVATGDLHPMTKEPIAVSMTRNPPDKPWTPARRQSIATPSDRKPKKPLDSFKPRRTPLAELDPNSFTPSPSQQRLLAQQNLSWSSSPITSRPSLLRSTTSLPATSRVTEPRNTERLSTFTVASASVSYPSKRQRLCQEMPYDDNMLPSEGVKVEVGRSRFFTSSIPDPSPSSRRNQRNKSKASTVNIWSDESVEDIMLGLPDTSEDSTIKKEPRINIYQDFQKTHEPNSNFDDVVVYDTSQSSTLTDAAINQLSAKPLSSTSSSISSGIVETKLMPATDHKDMHEPLSATLEKPSEQRGLEKISVAGAQPDIPQLDAVSIKNTTPKIPLAPYHSIDILQQSRNVAPGPSRPPSISRSFSYTSKNHSLHGVTISAAVFVVPRSPETPKGSIVTGSEDLLVANSEDELDGQSVSAGEESEKPKLCLDRFAFSG
ncbi:Rad2 nuclease [Lambiella insularis]|nr:Rad2 nuclease [Lambiella insularis]